MHSLNSRIVMKSKGTATTGTTISGHGAFVSLTLVICSMSPVTGLNTYTFTYRSRILRRKSE